MHAQSSLALSGLGGAIGKWKRPVVIPFLTYHVKPLAGNLKAQGEAWE